MRGFIKIFKVIILFITVIFITACASNRIFNQCTYSFIVDGESIVNEEVVDKGSAINSPDDPVKEGHIFIGWKDNKTNELVKFPYEININVTFEAVFEPITFKITYILNDGINSNLNLDTYEIGREITLDDPYKAGYKFIGWKIKGEEDFVTFPYKVVNDVTFEAIFEKSDFTITYILNGGVNSKLNLAIYKAKDEIILENPFKEGYNFTGWKIEGEEGFVTFPYKITSDITLEAIFEPITYQINYYIGKKLCFTQDVKCGEEVELLSVVLNNDTLLSGWTDKEEKYKLGDKIVYNYSKNTDLYGYVKDTSSNILYLVLDEDEVELMNYFGTSNNVVINGSIKVGSKDYTVTSIGDLAFALCFDLASVTIPNSITNIGTDAFRSCDALSSINIPGSVTKIGTGAFSYCSSLTSINVEKENSYYKSIDGNLYSIDGKQFIQYAMGKNKDSFSIPNTVTTVEAGAFSGCYSLKNIIIPDSVTKIGNYAFSGCNNLLDIKVPDSVTVIGKGAFSGCKKITEFNISKNVTEIGENAFDNCISLISINVNDENLNYKSVDGVLYSKDEKVLIKYPRCKTDTNFKVPITVEIIENAAFSWCDKLEKISIQNKVQIIGDFAFSDCVNLYDIIIPNSVKKVGSCAFSNCEDLRKITISNSVETIGDYAFSNCSKLSEVTIPSNVTSIGDFVFDNCDKLTNIKVDNKNNYYKSVDGNLYSKDGTVLIKYAVASNNKTLVIPNTVRIIKEHAFYYSRNLQTVIIPESVSVIEQYAFSTCENLTINCEAKGKPDGWNANWNSANCPVVWGYVG